MPKKRAEYRLAPAATRDLEGIWLRYDNERGKGDHRHVGEKEEDYTFTTLEKLLDDFERDVENWR